MPTTIDKYKIAIEVIGEKAIKALDDRLNGLQGRLAQIGITAFIANAYRMADSMKDLADATGLTSGYVQTFSLALEKAGGEATSVDKILTTFYRTLEEMASGSDNAERSLNKLGITFDDLKTKSEKDILAKALKSLAAMGPSAERTARGIEIFGKSFAQVDPRVLEEILRTADTERLTAELDKAAEVVGILEQNFRDLQLTTIAVINQIVGNTDNLRLSIEGVGKVVKLIGALVLVSLGANVLRTIYSFATAWKDVSKAIVKATAAQSMYNALIQVGEDLKKGKGGRGIGAGQVLTLAATGATIYALYDQYKTFSEMVDNATNSVLSFNAVTSDLDGVPMEAMTKYSDGIKELQKQLKAGTISQEEFNRKAEELAIMTRKPAGGAGAFPDAGPFTDQEKEARARAVASAQRQTDILRQQYDIQTAYAEKLLETIGIDEDRAALARELAGIQQDYDLKRLDYQEKIAEELAKGKDANMGLVEEYIKQFQALDSQQTTAEKLAATENNRLTAVKKTSIELQKQLDIIDLALATTKNQIEIDKFLAIAKGELSESDAEYQAERQAIQAESDAEIKRLEEQLKNEINEIEKEKVRNSIAAEKARTAATLEGVEKRREAEKESNRTAAAGMKKVFDEIAESITPAQVAADSLRSVFRNLDNALTEFVTKGKFSFKDFARSIIADIALIIARALVMQAVLSILGIFSPGAAASLKSILGGGVTPKAKGGAVSPGKAYLVGEEGPELAMFDRPGTIIPNNQLAMAGAGTQVTYNINAVDAASFRSLVARDPQFLYNVTEVGRRSNPARRLA